MNTVPHANHGFFMNHSLPQLIRTEPVMHTEEALEVLNALMGRFPTDSVVGQAILSAVLEIERDIEESMKAVQQ